MPSILISPFALLSFNSLSQLPSIFICLISISNSNIFQIRLYYSVFIRSQMGAYVIFKYIKRKVSYAMALPLTLWLPKINFTFCMSNCSNDSPSSCTICWRIGNFLSGYRLAPLYIALGVALLIWPNSLWLSSVVGIQLLILALLRLCTIFRFNGGSGEVLLSKQDNREYFEK